MREILTLPHGRRRATPRTTAPAVPAEPLSRACAAVRPGLDSAACADCRELAWTTTAAFEHPALRKLRVLNADARSGDDSIHQFRCEHCDQLWEWNAQSQWSMAKPPHRPAPPPR